MPPVFLAIGQFVAYAATTVGISGVVGTAWLGFQTVMMVGMMVYGQVAAKSAKRKARDAYNASLQDRMSTRLSSDMPKVYAYGECVIGTSVVAIFTSGDRDQFKHLVCVHCAHESHSISDIWIADKKLIEYQKSSTGNKFETWSGNTHVLDFTPEAVLSVKAGATAATAVTVPYTLEGAVVTLTEECAYASCSYTQTQTTTTAWVTHHLGTPTDPVDAELHALKPADWPATSVLRGYTYSVIKLDLTQSEFQGGIPSVKVLGKWKKLYDPRTGLTAWSDNNALVELDYLTSEACRVNIADLPIASYITAANVCDETISIGKRYTFNGSIATNEDPHDVLEKIADSMAGSFSSTTWEIWAGKYVAPVMSLDLATDLVGKLAIAPGVSEAALYNGVKGQYIGEETGWVQTDVKPYQNAAYKEADGGDLWTDMPFPYTSETQRIHNLMRIFVEDQRNGYTITGEFSRKTWKLKVGQRVWLSSAFFGWDDKVFRVLNRKYSPSSNVELVLKEDAASIWDEADAVTVDETPNSTLPDVYNMPELSGLTLQSGATARLEMSDGKLVPRIHVTWDAPLVTGIQIEVEWALEGADIWNTVRTEGTDIYLAPVQDEAHYIVRARTVSKVYQAESDWAYGFVTASAESSPPSDVTGFSVSQNDIATIFQWDLPPDTKSIAGFDIRYNPAGDEVWEHATPLTQVTKGTQVTSARVPPGDWTFLICARNEYGDPSVNPAAFSLTVTNKALVIYQSEQSEGLPGTAVNFVEHWTGVLVPGSTKTAAEVGWELFDTFCPSPEVICTYECPEIDIAVDGAVRVYGEIISAFAMGETGMANPQLQINYKVDGGAYFADWINWTIGMVTARYIKMRIRLDTTSSVPYIKSWKPTVDATGHNETRTSVVAAGGTYIEFAVPFHTAPSVSPTVIGTAGLTVNIASITNEGFTAHVFNAGTNVGGTITWNATGV